jgi:dTDP-glucose pyrophosphorylase
MNVVVPLGGIGQRFQDEGYPEPKPFVPVLGKEMIMWVLDNLSLGPQDNLIIVYNPSFLNMADLMRDVVKRQYVGCQLVELTGPTRGAAETVLIGLQALPHHQLNRPCVLADGDCFYTKDILQMYRRVSATHNATICFTDTQPVPRYSYVTLEPNSCDVKDIKEKIKISDNANTGCYCFRNGIELKRYCTQIIEAGAMQLSQDMKGEFYTSGVIRAMLDDNIPCKMLHLNLDDFFVLGTPAQVKKFCVDWPGHREPVENATVCSGCSGGALAIAVGLLAGWCMLRGHD